MSGTSLDGIDVAVIDVSVGKRRARVVPRAFGTVAYSRALRTALLRISDAVAHVGTVARLHTLLGERYAEAFRRVCRKHGVPPGSVELIGCHGQTIYHDGDGVRFLGKRIATTLQIGDGSVLAERTGIPVVSDFRTRDMAAGGRGAPLVPYVDYLLFRHPARGRVALNIGGIANITAIPAGAGPEKVIAFDTGPGNMVIDALASHYSQGRLRLDCNGRLAARGKANEALIRVLLRARYFHRPPPKTAGREQFGEEYVRRLLNTDLGREDVLATATALTAVTIGHALDRFVRPRMRIDDLIVSGGGVHNRTLMAYLAAYVPGVRIYTSAEFGVDPDAKEAVAFAVLAYETWRKRPSNLPAATGARRPVVLGKISP